MGIEPITSVLQTDASPSRPQTALVLCASDKRFVNLAPDASSIDQMNALSLRGSFLLVGPSKRRFILPAG